MKKLISIIALTVTLFGWETNTHRAIDRKAIERASNLKSFIESSALQEPFDEQAIQFDGYGMTYIQYIRDGENNGLSKYKQSFSDNDGLTAKIQDLLEAGTILEDAQWFHPGLYYNQPELVDEAYDAYDRGDGRFMNHFCNAQGQKSQRLLAFSI